MNYYIVIPAHNEEAFLTDMLSSIVKQTLQAKKVVIVNDNSKDKTEAIIDQFVTDYTIFQKCNSISASVHMPGSKVINAFNKGLALLDDEYDFIVKLDADLILPENYFERIAELFNKNEKIGLAGGFVYEQNKNGEWLLNHPMNKDHVRGAFKAYTKTCFKAIGGLKSSLGWDTVDELLAQYYGFEVYTDTKLKVKHLRPLGKAYNAKAKYLQGKAFYVMRYGLAITFIASLKRAVTERNSKILFNNITGYFKAKNAKESFIVNAEEGKFIRKLRWSKIRKRFF